MASLPFRTTRPRGMTSLETQALTICHQALVSEIDPLIVALTLNKCYPTLRELSKHQDRTYVTEVLLTHLPENIAFMDFVNALDECGYKKLAAKVLLTFINLNTKTGVVNHVYKTSSGQRPHLSKMVVNLKKMVDDAPFKDPRLALSQLGERRILKMNQEQDLRKKQLIADECVAILGAEIDAIAITFDKGLRNKDCFEKIKLLTGQTSNTLLTDGVYYGRLANANAIAGHFDECENMLQAARCKAYHIAPCFELLFMIVIEVQVRLYSFEKNPTKEERRSLLMWARMGLDCAENGDLDSFKMWRRSFILRMVFCLLGLGNRGNVIENCFVDNVCIHEASELLADIDKNWTGIETRRKMFYYVARARIAELTGQMSHCEDYLQFAIDMALEGHFDELRFLTEYLQTIRRRHTMTSAYRCSVPQTTSYTRTEEFHLSQHITKSQMISITRECPLAAELSHSLFGANASSSSHGSVTNSNTSVKMLAETIYARNVESEVGEHCLAKTDLLDEDYNATSYTESKLKEIEESNIVLVSQTSSCRLSDSMINPEKQQEGANVKKDTPMLATCYDLRHDSDTDPKHLYHGMDTDEHRGTRFHHAVTGLSPDTGTLDTPSFHNHQLLPLHSATEPFTQRPSLSGRSSAGDTNLRVQSCPSSSGNRNVFFSTSDIVSQGHWVSFSNGNSQREITRESPSGRSDAGQTPLQTLTNSARLMNTTAYDDDDCIESEDSIRSEDLFED